MDFKRSRSGSVGVNVTVKSKKFGAGDSATDGEWLEGGFDGFAFFGWWAEFGVPGEGDGKAVPVLNVEITDTEDGGDDGALESATTSNGFVLIESGGEFVFCVMRDYWNVG